jgi:hypothetical protein
LVKLNRQKPITKGGSLVNTILLQKCQEFIDQIINFFAADEIRVIEEMETTLKEYTDSFILEMMSTYLENLDKAIEADKSGRRQKGIVIERKNDKREIFTVFGTMQFSRTYYYDKRQQEYTYLLDRVVGLERNERVTGTVAVNLVEHASKYSYAKSSHNITGGAISRQTVMNKVRLLDNLKIENSKEKKIVKVLHIDADEDHVAMQDGSNAVVPLISVYEGIRRIGGRGQCINPHHISSYGKEPEELWLEAANWIYSEYDVNFLERIYLHGDGAQWIKVGLDWLPKAKLVLDKYHLNKSILQATGGHPERRREIYAAIRIGDLKSFKRSVSELIKNTKSEKEQKKIKDFKKYIINNWQAIEIYSQENCGGSGTEGHVSHVLSSRLSSRPMGWSRKGLKAMTELRAYISSGGRVKLEHLKQTKKKAYNLSKAGTAKMQKMLKHTQEQFNNITILNRGKVIPMFRCLKGLQKGSFEF